MLELKAPAPFAEVPRPWVFLAGSIEQGTADRWQLRIVEALESFRGTILNPRRDAWDDTWEQSMRNPKFREQGEWELDGQTQADLILMYFDPDTKSPVTLVELGLFKGPRLLVCCPEGFWRKGNVDLICARYRLDCVETFDAFLDRAATLVGALDEEQRMKESLLVIRAEQMPLPCFIQCGGKKYRLERTASGGLVLR